MSQTYSHDLLTSVDSTVTGDAATHQDNVSRRSFYVSSVGAMTATLKLEVSPDASGDTWFEAASITTVGVTTTDVICKRIRARVSAWTAGVLTCKMVAMASA
mgnify:FL=1